MKDFFNFLTKMLLIAKILGLSKHCYYEQTANVRIGSKVTGEAQIKKRVRQSCVLSTDLFNLYSESVLRGINDFKGIKANGVNLNNIRYAVLISTSQWQLQKMLNEQEKIGEHYRMSINDNKTESLAVTKLETVPTLTLYLKGNQLNIWNIFDILVYLFQARCTNEIKKRIALAIQAFIDVGYILRNKKMSFSIRFRL